MSNTAKIVVLSDWANLCIHVHRTRCVELG